MDIKENIEAGQNKERKSGRNWNKSYVIFLVLPIILTILVHLGGLPYLCGRLNYSLTVVCMLYPIVNGFIIYCFVIGVEDMVIPPSVLNQIDEHWLLVEPGGYVWERG